MSFEDLASDVAAAIRYVRSRREEGGEGILVTDLGRQPHGGAQRAQLGRGRAHGHRCGPLRLGRRRTGGAGAVTAAGGPHQPREQHDRQPRVPIRLHRQFLPSMAGFLAAAWTCHDRLSPAEGVKPESSHLDPRAGQDTEIHSGHIVRAAFPGVRSFRRISGSTCWSATEVLQAWCDYVTQRKATTSAKGSASRAAERAGDGLDRILRHLRRRARERVAMTRRLVEMTRRRGPERDSGPSLGGGSQAMRGGYLWRRSRISRS